jgi:FkbM family methyltransferase
MFKFITSLIKKSRKIYYALMGEMTRQAITTNAGIKFFSPSELCSWRAETLFKKEPETLKWIDTFDANDIFWDIGANVGVYSMYAAVHKKVKTYAFEPSPFNFYVLSKNIYLNNVSSCVSAFCLAFAKNTSIDYLNLTSINEGAAHSSFQNTTNEFGNNFTPEYSQSTLGFGVDDFIKTFNISPPNHIKIDVDGAEKFVISGAPHTLTSPDLKSILIEMNSPLNADEELIFNRITSSGFQLERSHHPDGDTRLSNYIFRRIS